MGKQKKERAAIAKTDHSPSTVFVSNLPYTFTNAQLEETFSDVGPIRRCFMVTEKGSSKHRGFGYVQFAVLEDANRAIQLKNASSIGGRKAIVKPAMHRAPLQQRRAKVSQDKPVLQSDETSTKSDNDNIDKDHSPIKEDNHHSDKPEPEPETEPVVPVKQKPVPHKKPPPLCSNLPDNQESFSGKQRVARTVIFGGLRSSDMAEEVHRCAKEGGGVCSVTFPIPKEDFQQHGLEQDGCRPDASAILFTSVKLARAAVEKLHQKVIKGGMIWARQLGGEGAKAQKWKLIIRNLPFQAKASEIKEMFSAAGFTWDVFIPQNSETGLSRGFAFVKFTCKQDAENAIKKFNGQKFGKRSIAVDWAVSKKIYDTVASPVVPSEDGQQNNGDSDSGSDISSVDFEEDDENTSAKTEQSDDASSDKEDLTEIDLQKEADISRKILDNLIKSSSKNTVDSVSSKANEEQNPDEKIDICPKVPSKEESIVLKNESDTKSKPAKPKQSDGEDDVLRTIFISNLPFDVEYEEVKQRFSVFGEVQSFFPVLHPVTKRPKGTGFLKFKKEDAVGPTIAAANAGPDLGILLKGRQLTVMKALDKKSAQEKEQEKTKVENLDHRNLYLAKEGIILEGTPAANGVSASDMAKRKRLQEGKSTKLQSPNFHVSRTRLIIYNLPKTMTEKELKKLCIEAVVSRASKQKPTIRQVKFLKGTPKGKNATQGKLRGVAFVEFSEHQHALVCLRVLNNNPETFGPENRPIVEFALDNIQTMKLRKFNQEKQQHGPRDHLNDDRQNQHGPRDHLNDDQQNQQQGPRDQTNDDQQNQHGPRDYLMNDVKQNDDLLASDPGQTKLDNPKKRKSRAELRKKKSEETQDSEKVFIKKAKNDDQQTQQHDHLTNDTKQNDDSLASAPGQTKSDNPGKRISWWAKQREKIKSEQTQDDSLASAPGQNKSDNPSEQKSWWAELRKVHKSEKAREAEKGFGKMANPNQETKNMEQDLSKDGSKGTNKGSSPKPKTRNDYKKQNAEKPLVANETKAVESYKPKKFMDADLQSRKRKQQEKPEQLKNVENMTKNRKRAKGNKDPLGRDGVDNLDMLIEEYKSQFSRPSSKETGGVKLRRWFQS
ncbi:hypothetical protein ACFE04_001645 [Oxalis oulophora]